MFSYFGLRRKKDYEYIRVFVMIGDQPSSPSKKFCIDPQVTDLHTIRQLIHLAFDINRALIINWITYDGVESLPTLETLNTDRDFRKALKKSLTSQLIFQVDFDPAAEEYNVMEYHKLVPDPSLMQHGRDSINGEQINLLEQARSVSYMYLNLENPPSYAECSSSTSTDHTLTADSAKSLSDNLSAQNIKGSAAKVADFYAISDKPLTKLKFGQMFDADGRMTYSYSAFKLAVYQGGVEPSIRPAVWRLLLNVVDYRSTDEGRKAQVESYAKKYTAMRNSIIVRFGDKVIPENLRNISNTVRRDVIRTDRNVPYFGGDEDSNQHLMSMFNILVTYALTHPSIGYCQGMSDLAAPLLYVFDDEAEAYVGFCALMRRCGPYFITPINLMSVKYKHFSALVKRYEPDFWVYSDGVAVEEVMFCYRWLLLEMKREFVFDEAVDLMPIMWASIPTIEADIPSFKPVILFDLDPTKTDDAFVLPWNQLRNRPSPTPQPQQMCGTSQATEIAVKVTENRLSADTVAVESAKDLSDEREEDKRLESSTRSKHKAGVERRERKRKTISLRLDCSQRPQQQSIAFSCPDDVLSQAVHRYFMEGHNRRGCRHFRDTEDDYSGCWKDLDTAKDFNRRKDGSLIRRLKTVFQDKKVLPNNSTASKSKSQQKSSRTSSCSHLDANFGIGAEIQGCRLWHNKSLPSRCKSALSLLESDADDDILDKNNPKKWAEKVAYFASPKISHKRLYSTEKSDFTSNTSSDRLSSRLGAPESNGNATPNKRIRFSSTIEQTSPTAIVNNGDQLNHFHDHSFDVVDHGATSDSDDSGIGTASSTLKDSSGCRMENVSLSGSIASEKSANCELLSNMKNRLSNAESLVFSTMLLVGDFQRRFCCYWSLFQQFTDLTVEKDRREVFTGYKYAKLFNRLMNTCLHSLRMTSLLSSELTAASDTCSTRKGCDCESCQTRMEKFYFTERVQFPVSQKPSVENFDDVDDKAISDIENSYDSFIIIQPSEEHIFRKKNAVNFDANTYKERSCSTVSKSNKQLINSETRIRRVNRFFASLFRRSSLKRQRRRSISNISSTTSTLPSRETPVKDDEDLLEGLNDDASDYIESATSDPVPMAVDATEEFFDDFRRRLTLSHIHDLCSSRSSSAVSTVLPTTGRRSPPPSTSIQNHPESKSPVTNDQSSIDNQRPSTSAQAQAEQNNQTSEDLSDFIIIPEDNLPPIEYIGGGNPFMIFVGLAIINLYRKRFFKQQRNCRESCVYFDKLVRKYNYAKVLVKARRLYANYLKSAGY